MEKISEKELESIMGLLFDINGHNRMNNPHLDIIFKAGFEAGMKHVNNGVLDDVIVSQNYHCYNCQSKNIKTTKYKCRDCKYEGRKG